MNASRHDRADNPVIGIAIALVAACLLAACTSETDDLALASPDRARFELEVLPVLIRDCGFHTCHGSRERFFQVMGPGRPRLDAATLPLDPLTQEEVEHAYQRARSMLDVQTPAGSLLLRKPLAVNQGGSGHEGTDDFGRDVYTDVQDPGFQVLYRWVVETLTGSQPAQPMQGN